MPCSRRWARRPGTTRSSRCDPVARSWSPGRRLALIRPRISRGCSGGSCPSSAPRWGRSSSSIASALSSSRPTSIRSSTPSTPSPTQQLRSPDSSPVTSSGRSLSHLSEQRRVGFIGLGNLGRPLAASLLAAGYPLTVHDRDAAAAQRLLADGAAWADSPAGVGAVSDTVFTCLPSPQIVAAVVAGENGLLSGLERGGTWIDSSTNDRHELERLAELAAEQGTDCLEAPVTGGVHLATSGQITVIVGGEPAVFAAHLPLFEAIGGKVFHVGPLGSASVIKVITNMLAFIHLVAAGEALMLARRGGLDLAQAFEVIKASSGTSFVHETESQVILNGSYDIGFTLDLACKDLGFAHDLGDELGVPLELATLVEQAFSRAREAYGGDAWSPMVVKLLE